MKQRGRGWLCLILLLASVTGTAAAQETSRPPRSPLFLPLIRIGSPEADRARTFGLVGDSSGERSLILSTHLVSPPLESGSAGFHWAWIAPELRIARNSALPLSLNDGAMWAGRGWTTWVMTGARAQLGPVSLTLAPEFGYAENRTFRIRPSTVPGFSSFVAPWYTGPLSIDQPYRPGDASVPSFSPGQSRISVDAGPVTIGAATEDQWWGPGIRNAIVLSNNAAGIPHVFVRSASPVQTRVGDFEAKALIGALTESLYFDTTTANDVRSFSAFAATYRPRFQPGLTVGVARAVYAGVNGAGDIPAHALDAFRPVRRSGSSDAVAEQITSLFGRWTFPADGLELYTEWARLELPGSIRDFLAAPNHTQGYTLGLQWAAPVAGDDRLLRLGSELSYLEQSTTARSRPTSFFYVSPSIPQGYTQRGQVIGAAIGPGASSQALHVELLDPSWQVGFFGARIRWDNDAYYRSPNGSSSVGHDISVLGGIRAAATFRSVRVAAEVIRENRLNYLYQNVARGFTSDGAVDVDNTSLRLTIRPSF